MFNIPINHFKNYFSFSKYKPCGKRSHFPGNWGRRELKESPIQASKLGISPIKLTSQKTCQSTNEKAVRDDKYALFYCFHFIYAEELFYGHIALLVIIAKGDGPYLTKTLKANRDKSLEITKFKFLKKLGNGAFGTVFLAEHPTRGELVAVKKVLASDVSHGVKQALRIVVEKEASCSTQNSPHVIQLLDTFSITKGSMKAFYFVYEYADGGDLSNLINKIHYGRSAQVMSHILYNDKFKEMLKYNSFVIPMTKYLSAQILLGVLALHERGIVHLDLKPDNILITSRGIIKIADLGMVKRYRWFHYSARAEFLHNLNKEIPDGPHLDFHYVGGTLPFMEPELRKKFIKNKTDFPTTLKFDSTITFSADYFSVGLIIFNILTGFLFGCSQSYDSSLPVDLQTILRDFNDLLFVVWYAYKPFINYKLKTLETYSSNYLYKFLHGEDKGILSLLNSTLKPRKKRWGKYTVPVNIKRDGVRVKENIICIEKIKNGIPLFTNLNFEEIAINGLPKDLSDFIPVLEMQNRKPINPNEFLNKPRQKGELYSWPFFEYHKPYDQIKPRSDELLKSQETRVTRKQYHERKYSNENQEPVPPNLNCVDSKKNQKLVSHQIKSENVADFCEK